jgi:hypothetical protein
MDLLAACILRPFVLFRRKRSRFLQLVRCFILLTFQSYHSCSTTIINQSELNPEATIAFHAAIDRFNRR